MGRYADVSLDIDDLIQEAKMLKEKLATTAIKLEAFTEQLQANVDRLRQVSAEEQREEQDE